MITTQWFSQRDPHWASDKHGTSSSTIGATGCTISVLCTILNHAGYNESPKTVDDKLATNGGYANGNLIIWTVVPKLWPKLKWIGRFYSYDDAKAKELIAKGMIPLVEVSAAPIGGTAKHWIGALGDGKTFDPFALPSSPEQIAPFSKWTATGMSFYEYTPVSSQGGQVPDNTINVPIADWEKVRSNSETLDKVTDQLGLPRNASYSQIREKLGEKEKADYQRGYEAGYAQYPQDNPAGQPAPASEIDLTKYAENGKIVEEVIGNKKIITNYKLK